MPADLLARRAICFLLEEFSRQDDFARELADLERDFVAGLWYLDQPTWELTAMQLAKWTGRTIDPSAEQLALTAVGEWLWTERLRPDASGAWEMRRVILVVHETSVTVFARRSADDVVTAVAVLPDVVQARLQRTLPDTSRGFGRITLLTDAGQFVTGPRPNARLTAAVRHLASETGLPWTVVVNSAESSGIPPEISRRRQLMMAGLAAIVMLLAGGSYLLWRVVQRDLAVARLQTNFVAAVSHEFRTPLASLRHVTELLEEDDALPPQERRSFYGVLARNTERLQRLVESLLDFARMEDGRKPYPQRRLDVSALVTQVVDDFRRDDRSENFAIDCDTSGAQGIEVRADPVSLAHSLWNLLDNAVKYSPDRRSIQVAVERHPAGLAISVRDEGLGIPGQEQKDIFLKFVRGSRASQLGIKGTGLGLAMVAHVMNAHGGSVEVDSEEGVGSTFRLVLPVSRTSPNVEGGPAQVDAECAQHLRSGT
jgi:signal transduction histidine kinase